MPPPLPGLFGKELVNVPVKLLYSRRALLQKIIANAAKRKTQLHMDATGARMSATPDAFNFGKTVFNNMHKQAAPVSQVLGPLLKRLSGVAGKAVGGLKTYGKRLTGDSTLKPLQARGGLLKDLDQTLMQSRRPLADEVGPLRVLTRANSLADKSQTVLQRDLLTDKAQSAYRRWRDAIKNNDLQRLAFGGGRTELNPHPVWGNVASRKNVSGGGISGDVSKLMGQNSKAIEKELDAIRKTRLYTGGAAAATGGYGLGSAAYNNLTSEKQSDNLPPPSSRGETKKITMPESDDKEPDLDPEGVQMTDHDHDIQKEARFGTILKMLAKGVYKTPRSLKALTAGGTGGYVAGRQHGHQMGMDAGREDAAKTLSDLLQKKQKFSPVKQAFTGVGASKKTKSAEDDDKAVKEAAAALLATLQQPASK
jgi:hypothetical protein